MKFILLLFYFHLIIITSAVCQTFTLINQTNKVKIIVPKKPTVQELEAAKIFKDYIEKILSRKLIIDNEKVVSSNEQAIYIGNTNHANHYQSLQIKNDGFIILTDQKNLMLKAGDDFGLKYSVHTFFEKYLNCLMVDSTETITQKTDSIVLQQNIIDVQNPSFLYRESYYPNAANASFAAFNKLHNFDSAWGLWGHSFFKILPPDKYFKQHPEYYSLVNGDRIAAQLCLSNRNVYNHFKFYLRNSFKDNPQATYWSIAANDNYGFCSCEECENLKTKYGGNAGLLLYFVNKIAKKYPDKTFTTLAYNATAKTPNIAPEKNVVIMLSSIDANRNNSLEVDTEAKSFRENLNKWSKLTSNIFVWDYTTQFTNYLTPFPYYEHIASTLKYLKNHHVNGVFIQGSGNTYSDLADYNNFMQAKLLWNVDANADSLKNVFLNNYYKDASDAVNKYLDSIHHHIQLSKTSLDIYDNPINLRDDYLSPAKLNEYLNLLDAAMLASNGDTIVENRIKKIRLGVDYIQLQQSKFFGTDSNGYLEVDSASYQLKIKKNWLKKIESFVASCNYFGVKELSEDGDTPQAYLENWINIINQHKQLNKAYQAKIEIENNYSSDYPGKGNSTLIDNIFGEKDYTYNWLYFYGKDLISTISLNKLTSLDSIQVSFLNDQRHYIFLPEKITLELSHDGITFNEVETVYPKLEPQNFISIEKFNFKTNAIKSKYIRIQAKCIDNLPKWQNFIKREPAICCDEIFLH